MAAVTVGGDAAAVVPEGYVELLEQLKVRVRTAQGRAARAANIEVVRLYYSVGADILARQDAAGWGAKIVDRLAADLRAAFPDQRGWSRRNLLYMRALAAAWPDEDEFVHQAGAQLPWRHLTTLLDRLDSRQERDWYATYAVEHGWSRAVLEHRIASRLHQRLGAAPSNFTDHLPPADSDLAQDLVRDPYVFDHLALRERVSERDLEQALMDRLQATLLEFGHGMAFVGRQVRFDVGGDELVVDLLLFHVEQLRYLVVELKVGRFEPAHLGQLGTYVAVVEDRLRRPASHAPTLGLLLVAGRNEHLVRYALSASTAPMAVADYTYEELPAEARAALPSLEELAAALDPTSLPGEASTRAPGQDPD
jgi:predicted nuclease of restriction endonuclease-like (RecB) superfamily